MPSLRIALGQLNPTVGAVHGNAARVAGALARAEAWQADLLLVPELVLSGYPPEDLLLKPQFIAANRQALERLAGLTRSTVAIVGHVEEDRQGRLYNAASVLAAGRRVATYRKRYLPNYGVFDEQRYFTAGTQPLLLTLRGLTVGVTICEDLWAEAPCRELARAGAQLVVNISASPYHAGKLRMRQQLFSERAKRSGVAIAYCNLVGGQDELVFDGGSLLLDRAGRLLARAAQFQEDLLIVDLTPAMAGSRSTRRPAAMRLPTSARERPGLPLRREPALGPAEEVYAALRLGVRDYVGKNGFSTVVLGLSGGVDSALTACIAADALGPAHVKALIMPSRFSSKETQEDARQTARALGIEAQELSIEPVFKAYLETLAKPFQGRAMDVAEQNIQARIRGNLLMALSNKFGWLVLTTGNKSEMATGYCTLYGDMAGGFALIKDVPKMLVYELARLRNQRGPGAPIPARVLTRPPTAELAANQCDQDTLPPYDVLDRILKAYVEEDRSLRQIMAQNHADPELARRVVRMVDHSEYKRRQSPPGIKITPRAFGRDRRMPITNRFQES